MVGQSTEALKPPCAHSAISPCSLPRYMDHFVTVVIVVVDFIMGHWLPFKTLPLIDVGGGWLTTTISFSTLLSSHRNKQRTGSEKKWTKELDNDLIS